MRGKLKRGLLNLIYPSWGKRKAIEDGYTVVVPAPMDMPFLTYLSLQGLAQVDLSNCREILVVPDGCASDGGTALRDAIQASCFPNARLLPVRGRNRITLELFGHSGIAHWLTIVDAIKEAKTDLLYLHDADAFFTRSELIESNYEICKRENLVSLGVTVRWDPKFKDLGIQVPGTWELMFSAAWARRWTPIDHKAGNHQTALGTVFFDTMLYPQYRDFKSGLIRVVESDAFVHLSGTVVTYRKFLDFADQCVGDELFRLLFLSLLNELTPRIKSECKLPSVGDLAMGLTDSSRRVHYCFPYAAASYTEFRETVKKLVDTKLFASQAQKIEHLLLPFDQHFLNTPASILPMPPKMRAHGLWLS